ncbi:MAG: methyltransferase domain-containing protein [Pseudomonadota bacterium]
MDIKATADELEAGRGYDALFVPALFAPWPAKLIAAARVEKDQTVLDIACGSGVLTRALQAAVGPGGRAIGLDPAPGMLAAAAEHLPDAEWVLAPAEALPMGEATFDAVLCQFGMMFFKDRQGAAAEMLRVLKPQGSLAVAVWNALDHNPAYRDIVALLDAHLGRDAGDAVRMPFNLGDAAALCGVFEAAGFAAVSAQTLSEPARFPSPRVMVEAELRGWLPLFGISLDEPAIAALLEKADQVLAGYRDADGAAAFATSAHIVTARKPG